MVFQSLTGIQIWFFSQKSANFPDGQTAGITEKPVESDGENLDRTGWRLSQHRGWWRWWGVCVCVCVHCKWLSRVGNSHWILAGACMSTVLQWRVKHHMGQSGASLTITSCWRPSSGETVRRCCGWCPIQDLRGRFCPFRIMLRG